MEQDQESSALSPVPTTHWKAVLSAVPAQPAQASAALEELCTRYWYPVYAFVRQRGNDVHTAEDLTQGFFAFVLERHAFDRVTHDKGRFRSFLLACLHHYLLNEHDRGIALKRGGGRKLISLDEELPGQSHGIEPVDPATPEKHFERHWAGLLVQRAALQLRAEFAHRGQTALFIALRPLLVSDCDAVARRELAKNLDMTPGAVKVALHRARRRFGKLLRQEVAHTVSQPEEVEPELHYLLGAIAE